MALWESGGRRRQKVLVSYKVVEYWSQSYGGRHAFFMTVIIQKDDLFHVIKLLYLLIHGGLTRVWDYVSRIFVTGWYEIRKDRVFWGRP